MLTDWKFSIGLAVLIVFGSLALAYCAARRDGEERGERQQPEQFR